MARMINSREKEINERIKQRRELHNNEKRGERTKDLDRR